LYKICYILAGFAIFMMGLTTTAKAQDDMIRRMGGRVGNLGSGAKGGGGDSLQHRTGLEDSITIRFRYLDSSRLQTFDSSLSDFTRRFPVPWYRVHLGNLGNASRSLLFTPLMKAGWDHGFHAYDIYNITVNDTRFYNTTRPYSELVYMLGSRQEQMIRLLHTQNIRSNWNVAIEYRLINSLGFFQNQSTNHNNYRISSWYQSKNKRYQNFFILVGTKLQSGESGGIKTDKNYLNDSLNSWSDRFTIPSQLGRNVSGTNGFFGASIGTGTFYTNATYLLRQQYDLGQKDSIVTDSSVIPLFYPRVRLEHTISYSTYHYRFRDNNADSIYYRTKYDTVLSAATSTFFLRDHWRDMVNDFSVYQFPDAKNAQQFIKVGASLQNLTGSFDSGKVSKSYYNFFLHGEYRNKTRNQKWDIEASGKFYVNGFNAGDYDAYISLKRFISKQIGYLQVGFQNVNRTPAYVFDVNSSFYLADPDNFKKENNTVIFGSLDQPHRKLKVYGSYYLVTNYTYFSNYYVPSQSPVLFNVLQVGLEKQIRLYKNWNWKTWIVLQQRLGDGPVNLPLFTTRNQLGYDGNLGFKNLGISFGLESRYFTPYKAPVYSPLLGQYSFQDTTLVRLHFPEISAYLHFRIKTFTAYVRAENLNSLNVDGFNFTNNAVPTINYPYPGLQVRVGIYWSFVN
jgi:hypothetical protein